MTVFAKQGGITDPPEEIVEHVFLKELQGYTLKALNEEPCEWVLRQFTIISALAQEQENQRKRSEQQAKRRR